MNRIPAAGREHLRQSTDRPRTGQFAPLKAICTAAHARKPHQSGHLSAGRQQSAHDPVAWTMPGLRTPWTLTQRHD